MDETEHTATSNTIELTANLVAAFVSNNNVPISDLGTLISKVHAAIAGLGNVIAAEPTGPEKPTPAQIRKSIAPDALISFEDGKSYKTLKRHLTIRGLTPDGYRAKYGLPGDYPMTSASYSAQRSALARSLGLGQQRKKATLMAATANDTVAKTLKTRGRPGKAAKGSEAAPQAKGRTEDAETA